MLSAQAFRHRPPKAEANEAHSREDACEPCEDVNPTNNNIWSLLIRDG